MPPDTTKILLNFKGIDSLKPINLKEIILVSNKKDEDKSVLGFSQNNWNNVVIPIFIPLAAFSLGLLLSRINSKFKLYSELKRKETFLFRWIELIAPRINEQIKGYEEYSVGLRNMEIIKSGLKNYNLQLDKLKLVDPLTLVSIFVTNKKGEEGYKNKIVFDIQNRIDFILIRQLRMVEIQKSLQEVVDIISKENNEHVKIMNNVLQELLQGRGVNNPHDKFVIQINRVYNNWTGIRISGLDVMKKNFIDIAIPICRKQLNEEPGDKLALDLLSILQTLDFVYDSKVMHFNSFAEQYETSAKSIKDSLDKLILAKQQLEKLKFKFLLSLK